MDYKAILGRVIPHVVAIVLMMIVSSVYFYPAWEGKSLQGEDVVGTFGQGREKRDYSFYENKTTVLWNGAIFSGMPDYVGAPYKGDSMLKQIFFLPQKMGVPREVTAIFWYMLGFYIMLISLGVSQKLATGGAVAFALSSYYIIIIMAGHYMKVYTLALIPPTMAGIFLCFNRKYIWGFILTAFFLAMQISMAHIQMIYYYMLALLIIGLIELTYQIKEKTYQQFLKTIAILFAAVALAIAPNYSRLINYYKYNDFSIRGSSELTIGNDGVKTNNGLDKDYINAWSSGIDESMMVIIPDVKGGITGQIAGNRDLMNKIPREYREVLGGFNKYWGNQPFSGGPNYLGVVFVLLFLIGAFAMKGKYKLQFLIPTVLFFLLSMGGNLSFFTDLFIDFVPLYNKFRAPVSILALAIIFLSFFAIYTLYKVISDSEVLKNSTKLGVFKTPKPVYLVVSSGLLVFLFINILFPEMFNSYISDAEQNQFDSLRNQPNVASQLNGIIAALTDFRIGIFRADLWRAVIYVVLVTGSLYLFEKGKIKQLVLIGLVVLFAVADFWEVGRRYVPIDNFNKKSLVKEAYKLTDADRQIYQMQLESVPGLQEKLKQAEDKFKPANADEEQRLLTYVVNKNSHYRVFNTTQNPFQENVTTNAHRSVGGYHAVKLRRYQDLIEQHISKMNLSVLNMLNTKYVINSNGLQLNPGAMGAAWFVDSVKWVENANDEILALNNTNLRTTAVFNKQNSADLQKFSAIPADSTAKIEIIDYEPDRMNYEVFSPDDKLLVFSEIYYPDWKVFIDGKATQQFQANYVLRSVIVPKGQHKIEFVFHPDHFYKSENISKIAFYLLVLALLLAIGISLRNTIKKQTI